MIDDMIDIIESLTLIMAEETAWLEGPAFHRGSAVVVEAKLRLVAALEVRVAQFDRQGADWFYSFEPDVGASLNVALGKLCAVSEPNRRVIARHIDLSTEMMGVVAAEVQRQSGARSTTYSARGNMYQSEMASPISVNTSL
jgi:flagellar biosynthesis/type III secretory pathway chaperone